MLHESKVSTTPDDPSRAVVAGLQALLDELGIPGSSVEEVLHGTTVGSNTILQRSGSTKAIVSMTGNGSGRQNVLVRADLLVGADSLEATSFQLEFLPNGTVCRGSVTNVQSFGFDGVCRMPDHTRRTVHARWQTTSGAQLRGTLTANDA